MLQEAVRVDYLSIPSRSKGFSDQTSEEEQAMQKDPGQMLRWKVLLYTITAMIACMMLLTSKEGKGLHEIRRVGSTFQTT